MGNTLPRGVLALLCAACGTVTEAGPDAAPLDGATGLDAATDATAADAYGPPLPGDWGAPELLVALNDGAAREASPTVTGDGLELHFMRWTLADSGPSRYAPWVARRAWADAEWGTPERSIGLGENLGIEISPDGLEMYYPRNGGIYRARRASRAPDARWTAEGELFEGAGRPTLSPDGLTIYYHGAAPAMALVRRSRATLADAWGDEFPAEMEYRRPAMPDGSTLDYYAQIDRRGDLMLLGDPWPAHEGQALAPVGEVRRLSTGFWGEARAVPRMIDGGVEDCELVSETEAICSIDTDEDSKPDELVRVWREVAP
jgi:hypothetical protein